jgi:uncharacterized membrane-anchored protein
MNDEGPEIRSAFDAVRCFYLAGVAKREGHEEAARRLHAKAVEWTEKSLSGGGKCKSAPAVLEI